MYDVLCFVFSFIVDVLAEVFQMHNYKFLRIIYILCVFLFYLS